MRALEIVMSRHLHRPALAAVVLAIAAAAHGAARDPQRDCIGRTPPRAADPVADNFARLQVDAPSTHVPPVTARGVDDPMVSRVVETLRRWLADGGMAAGYGTAFACRTGR